MASGQAYPYGIALDSTYVCWTDYGTGTVMKTPVTGGTHTTLASGQGTPEGIVVDDASVYWITHGTQTANGTVAKTSKY